MFSGTSLIRLRLVPLHFRSNNYENGYILTNSDCYSIVLFHSCSSEEVDKCDKEIITFLPAVSVSTRSTMERGFEEGR